MTEEIFGIVANVLETDKAFRRGAKAWLSRFHSGGERCTWIAMSRGGRIIEKNAPTSRFDNFRAAWVPKHLRDRVFETGTRAQMEDRASFWNNRAADCRAFHPNRSI